MSGKELQQDQRQEQRAINAGAQEVQQQIQEAVQQVREVQPQQQPSAEQIKAKLADTVAWTNQEKVDEERRDYYEKVMKKSLYQNLAAKANVADLYWEAGKKETEGNIRVQKLPVARYQGKYTSAEKTELKKISATYSDADLCTVREMQNMNRYFEKGGYKKIEAEGNDGDLVLTKYVNRILSVPFDRNLFTDDYLSDHLHELYELTFMMEEYDELSEKYPSFFEGLDDDQLIQLELRCKYSGYMRDILFAHMEVHGLELVPGKKEGSFTVRAHDDTKEKRSEKKTRKAVAKESFEKAYDKFFTEMVGNNEIDYAECLVGDEALLSANVTESLAESIANEAEQFTYYEDAITSSFSLLKRNLEIRDDLINAQKSMLASYKAPGTPEEVKKQIAKSVAGNNSRFAIVSKNIRTYESVITFLAGATRDLPLDVEGVLKAEGQGAILDAVAGKAMIEGVVYDHYENGEKVIDGKNKFKGMIQKVDEIANEITSPALGIKEKARKKLGEVMNPYAKAYLSLTDEQKKKIRDKKIYRHERKLKDDLFNYSALGLTEGSAIGTVGDVLRQMMPEAYENIDKIRASEKDKDREVELVHAVGTQYLKEGHDVIEFDVGGSSFRSFSRNHNGFFGYGEHDEDDLTTQYGRKYRDMGHPEAPEYLREKITKGEGQYEGRKKFRYTMAGPSPDWGGLANAGEYSIKKTTVRIRDIGMARLGEILGAWKEQEQARVTNPNAPEPDYHQIDFMIRGHSRGGVGAMMGAMKLKYWIHKTYPEYEQYIKFHLIQYDAVPGKGTNWGGYNKVDILQKKNHKVKYNGGHFMPLGESAETTMIYSMNTQYSSFFTPEEVRGVKRLILTPFNHAVGLAPRQVDASQYEDNKMEKLHAMPFIDASTGKVYRQSGLNMMPEGVYIMDEHNVMVKIKSLADFIQIMQKTVPLEQQEKRHKVLLHAVAAKFNIRNKTADYMWFEYMKKNASYKEADKAGDLVTALKDIEKDMQFKDYAVGIQKSDIKNGAYRLENKTYKLIRDGKISTTEQKCDYIFGKGKSLPPEAKMHLAGNRLMKYCGLGGQINEVKAVLGTDEVGDKHYGVRIARGYEIEEDCSLTYLENISKEGRKDGKPVRIEYTANAIRQMTGIRLMLSLLGDKDIDPMNDLRCVVSETKINDSSVVFVSGFYLDRLLNAFSKGLNGKDLAKDNGGLMAFNLESMPALDKVTVDSILSLDKEKLKLLAGDLLDNDQLEAMNSRLEYMQGVLKDEIEKDEKRPEGEKRILSREQWQEYPTAKRVQHSLKENPDAIFKLRLEGVPFNIEGVTQTRAAGENAGADEVPQPEWEKLYRKIYDNMMVKIKSAANATEVLKLLTRFSDAVEALSFGERNSLETNVSSQINIRLFNELASKALFEAYMVEYFSCCKELIETIEKKVAMNRPVPDEYRDEEKIQARIESKVRKAQKAAEENGKKDSFDENAARTTAISETDKELRQQYAIIELINEGSPLLLEMDQLSHFIRNTSGMKFSNKTMNMDLVGTGDVMQRDVEKAFAKEVPGKEQFYNNVVTQSKKFLPDEINLELISEDKKNESMDAFGDLLTSDGKFFVTRVAGMDIA